MHVAVYTLRPLLAFHVTANEQDRAQVRKLAAQVEQATGKNLTLAYVNQGCTGEAPAQDAEQAIVRLHGTGLAYIHRLSRSSSHLAQAPQTSKVLE